MEAGAGVQIVAWSSRVIRFGKWRRKEAPAGEKEAPAGEAGPFILAQKASLDKSLDNQGRAILRNDGS